MIDDWLNEHIEQIAKGKIKVFVEDECHLKGGDICPKGYRFAYGYGWGDRQERLETPVKNYRDSQTYYGAMNCLTGEMILRSYSIANSSSTIEFVKELQSQDPEAKIALIWDGASHHRSREFRNFLAQTNRGQEWNVHCLRFARQRVAGVPPVVATAEVAPYAPEENPIENVWRQLKQMLRSEAMPLARSCVAEVSSVVPKGYRKHKQTS